MLVGDAAVVILDFVVPFGASWNHIAWYGNKDVVVFGMLAIYSIGRLAAVLVGSREAVVIITRFICMIVPIVMSEFACLRNSFHGIQTFTTIDVEVRHFIVFFCQ